VVKPLDFTVSILACEEASFKELFRSPQQVLHKLQISLIFPKGTRQSSQLAPLLFRRAKIILVQTIIVMGDGFLEHGTRGLLGIAQRE
jgi:hypothetical protein